MGSWGSEGGGIGPIVWVRRRNGSWWPGKILGPDELSECSLTSPRTGTPVKLLGREDASVDWYNLEKSKRVKAFRCGEFDDCIEKAESAQGMPIKKREKYARREDAILHALELEKQLGEQGKFGAASDSIGTKSSGSGKKKLASIHDGLGNHSEDLGNARLTQMPRGADVEIQDEMDASPIQSSGIKYSNQRTWEDDHSEATPRMRGLQDFGLRTAPLKRKYSSFDSDILGRDNHHRASLSVVPAMEKMSYANGGEQAGAIVRAKRSRCIYFPTRPTDPFDDKEHSSDQIRMSLQFEGSDHNPHCNLLKEENSSSGVMEDVESDYSQSVSSESDSSETEQDIDEDMTTSESGGNALGNHEVSGDQENTSSEEPDESPFSGDIAQLYPDDPYLSNEAVSKWPLKGKRNIRYLARESVHGANGEYYRSSTGMYHGMKGSTPGQRTYGADGAYLDERYIGAQMVGLNNGFPYSSRFPAQDHNLIDWQDVTWESRPAFKGHWEDGRQYFNPPFFGRHHFGGRTRSMLVAVDLKVQSSYRRERVPIVSLLSKLNGRAIIGHPLQIEALQDGSSEGLVIPKEDYYTKEPVVHDGSPTLPPAWKTARRSNFRVRRPHVLSVLGGDDSTDFPLPAEQERRPPFKKSMVSSLSQNASLVRKSLPHNPRPLVDKKFPRKPLKRVGLSSNQKTRTLSSIGVQQSFGSKSVHDTRTCQMDGLIKAETSGPTTVACIPVKLVFSRLLEKINRPSSKAVCKSVV